MLILAFVLTSCAGSTPPPDVDRVQPMPAQITGDQQLIQGTWLVTHNEISGTPLPKMNGSLFIFHNDGFRLGDDPPGYERFAMDPASSPKRIDFAIDSPPVIRGIYMFHGDALILCTAEAGKARPTKFETSPGTKTILTKLKRR